MRDTRSIESYTILEDEGVILETNNDVFSLGQIETPSVLMATETSTDIADSVKFMQHRVHESKPNVFAAPSRRRHPPIVFVT